MHSIGGAFEWVSKVEGWTIRGIWGCSKGKGDLVGVLIGPGKLTEDRVDGMEMEQSPRRAPT